MNAKREKDELLAAVRTAARLVSDLDAQRSREEVQYRDGYEDGFRSGYEVGYGRAEYEMDEVWAETARKVRALGSPNFRTWNEKRSAELEACKPRPGDFPGMDHERKSAAA